MNFAVAISQVDGGEVKIIAASADCQSVIDAYRAFSGPGKAWLCDDVHFSRNKRFVSAPAEAQKSESDSPKRSKKILP